MPVEPPADSTSKGDAAHRLRKLEVANRWLTAGLVVMAAAGLIFLTIRSRNEARLPDPDGIAVAVPPAPRRQVVAPPAAVAEQRSPDEPVPAPPPPPPPPPSPPPEPVSFTVQRPSVTFEPKIELPASRPRRSADLIIKSVTFSGTKESGAAWDNSGPPDPMVKVETTGLDGDSYATDVAHDAFVAYFNAKSLRVSEGDTLRIRVYDADVAFDDEAGSYEKRITADTLDEREVRWSFGRVVITLEFQP